MVRKIFGFVIGSFVLGAVVITLQQVAQAIHPLPEGLDPMAPEDAEAFSRHVAAMPNAAWIVAFLSEVIGAFCGALVAGWIAGDRPREVSGLVVGLALVFSIVNWTSFAHPIWFVIGQLILYPTALMGVWLILDRRPGMGRGGVGA